MRTYDDYLKDLRASTTSAYEYIPKMCEALREEDKHISNEDIKERVTKDCLDAGLSKGTIIHNIPEEFKDPVKVDAGKKGAARKKEIEILTDGNPADPTEAGQSPPEPKEQESRSSGSKEQEQDKPIVEWKPDEKDREVLRQELNNALIYIKKLEAINKAQAKPQTDTHDCSTHSMYLKAQAVIENERKEKEQYKQRVEEFDKITFVPASEAPSPPDMFQIPKDIDITKGQYHERLSPIQALGKIRQLLNAVTSLEIGWRVIE